MKNLKIIKTIEKTVVLSEPYIKMQDLFDVIREIENEDGFVGFIGIEWYVDEFPKIIYRKKKNEDTVISSTTN